MSTQNKDQKERNEHAAEENVTLINQVLIFAFFIFLVLLSYLVRS